MDDLFPDFVPETLSMYGKRYKRHWQRSIKNLRTYSFWWSFFHTCALTRFEWHDLPRGIDARYLEIMLIGYGSFAATRRANGSVLPFWCGRMTPIGNRDLYNNPNTLNIISPNGVVNRRHANWWISSKGSNQHNKRARLMKPDCAICWDNLTRRPLLPYIDLWATRLAEMDATIDQHSMALRVPYVIAVSEGGEKSAERLFNSIAAGEGHIYYYRSGPNAMPIDVLQTMQSGNYAGDKILNDQQKIVAQALTYLGIDNNAAAEKKERVQTAETLANNEQFLMMRDSYLRPRQEFCERAYDVMGREWEHASVEWAIPHMSETAEAEPANGGGELYADVD